MDDGGARFSRGRELKAAVYPPKTSAGKQVGFGDGDRSFRLRPDNHLFWCCEATIGIACRLSTTARMGSMTTVLLLDGEIGYATLRTGCLSPAQPLLQPRRRKLLEQKKEVPIDKYIPNSGFRTGAKYATLDLSHW